MARWLLVVSPLAVSALRASRPAAVPHRAHAAPLATAWPVPRRARAAAPLASAADDLLFDEGPAPPAPPRSSSVFTSQLPAVRYTSDDWWRNIRSIPRSTVFQRIAPHLAANVFVCVLVTYLRVTGAIFALPALPHQLTGAFLGLLVTFRTNSAYARFWEARCIWGKVRGVTEALAIGAATYIAPRAPEHARAIVEAVAEYPPALARTCKTQPGQPDRGRAVDPGGDDAIGVCQRIHRSLAAAEAASEKTFYSLQLAALAAHADKLVDVVGACGRIMRTPLPLSYSRHTSRFLSIWSFTLPFVLIDAVGYLATVPATAVLCWMLFGIEDIGHQIEQPFSHSDENTFDTSIPVDTLAAGIVRQVERAGKLEEPVHHQPDIGDGRPANGEVARRREGVLAPAA